MDCGSDSCPDRDWHTYEQYVECVLDRGDTEEDARAVWFGKKQSINRHDMSVLPFLKPPVPIARVIECHYDACSRGGIHTLDRLITCITAAGRPVDDALRCWNYHVSYEHRVPLDVLAFLDEPDAIVPAHEEPVVIRDEVPAPPGPPAARRCTRSGCHHTPAHVKNSKSYVKPVSRHGKKKNKGSLLPVLYSPPRPMDFKRLARVYSQVSDIDALMRHDGGHYNEAINPAPLALSVDCGYYGCIRKGRHSFTDLLECCQLDGQPAGNACSIWENAGGESVPCGPFLPPVVGSHREFAAAIKEPEAIDWSKKTSAFRDGFLLRHGRDMRVLMSAQQSLKEKPPVSFPEDCDTNEDYSPQGKMAYISAIRKGRFATDCYEHGLVMVGNYHRYPHCMHQIPDGCIRHADGTRITQYRPLSCGRLMCLECLLPACNKAAGKAVARLSKMMIKLRAGVFATPRKYIFHHFVYSLSDEHHNLFQTPAGRKKIYAMVRREIKRLGYVGGVFITHPWRFDDALSDKDWSPHIHVVAAGYVDHPKYRIRNAAAIMSGRKAADPISDLYNRTGDLYLYIRSFSRFADAFDTIAYTLSPCGSRGDRWPDCQIFR